MAENAKKNLGSRANSAFFDELTNLVSNVAMNQISTTIGIR